MKFLIGDICFGMDETLVRAQEPHVFSFASTTDSPQVHCTFSDTPPAMGDCLFDSGLTWRLHETKDGFAICMQRARGVGVENVRSKFLQPLLKEEQRQVRCGEVGDGTDSPVGKGDTGTSDSVVKENEVFQTLNLSKDLSRGQINARFEFADETKPFFSMDSGLFQLWASFILARQKGVLLHALGVKRDGEAHVFLGPSGMGKSTLAHIVAQSGAGEILSDDRIILRAEADFFRAYGTPWNGELHHHAADDAPLRAIYFLTQEPVSTLAAISAADAAARLFASASVAGWPIMDAMSSVLDATAAVAKSVQRYHLGFTPDHRVLDALGWQR